MKTTMKNCDCELCLFKTFTYNNPLANDNKKIIEAIVYHYIVRLSSLVKTRKDLNSYIIKFIMTINQSYLEKSTETAELKESINIMYKNLTDSGKCCRFSSNSSLTKLTHKEATYLKLIISSLGEGEEEREEENKKEKKKEVISPIEIIVDEVTDVINDVKTIVNDVQTVIEDVKTLATDIIPLVEECIMVEKKDISANETVPTAATAAATVQDASGSYYSYCVIS